MISMAIALPGGQAAASYATPLSSSLRKGFTGTQRLDDWALRRSQLTACNSRDANLMPSPDRQFGTQVTRMPPSPQNAIAYGKRGGHHRQRDRRPASPDFGGYTTWPSKPPRISGLPVAQSELT